ncbi:MAG: cyclic nucleotide-binding domain-containing protein [Luteolibacter sp.]|uniref:cyclic nucleotide-binding domain-containing protein n=1 Tax=Luteolibacter sp. TaxID=1962973 RepID=UPI0032638010
MAESHTSLASITRQTARPGRWDDPLDPEMSDATLDMLMATEPFASMDERAFPAGTPLRGILRADTAVREYAAGEIILRKDDYGTSAYLVLEGEVDVILRPQIDPQLLGRAPSVKKSFFARVAQLWNNHPEPEGWSKKSPRAKDNPNASINRKSGSVYLQDYPQIVSDSKTVALKKGQLFGEISALSRMPRTATVVASTKRTLLLEFSWEGLRDIMRYDSALKKQIDQIYRENSLKNFLRHHPLFSHLEESGYVQLCQEAQLENYGEYNWSGSYLKLAKDGEQAISANEPVIVREGEYSNGIYLISAGFCRVSQKYGNGERTLNYIGAGSAFGYEEIANHWKNPRQEAQSLYTLRSLGYAHLIFIPTPSLEKFANRALVETDFPASPVPENMLEPADARSAEDGGAPSSSLMEFMAEHRFFNGTKSMVIDMDRCTRCDDCVRACASTHDGNPRFLRHGPMIDNLMIANACMHCIDPVCMIGCPTGAIHRTSFGGEVVINPATCIGCGTCAANCPYDSIRMVEVRSSDGEFLVDEEFQPILKATKCDLCVEQTSGPACQNACPHDALSRTDLSHVTSLTQWLKRK